MENLCICRCCLTDGCYKDIGNEYFFSGQKEVYADLLLNTFGVTITHKEGAGPSSSSRLICEACIQRLREAAAFKQQILDAESNIEILLRKLRECEKEPNKAKTNNFNDHEIDTFSEHSYGDTDHAFQNDIINEDCATNENGVTNRNEVLDEFDLDLDDEVDDEAFDGFDDEDGHLILVHLIQKEEELKITKKNTPRKKVKKSTSETKNKENVEKEYTRKKNSNRTQLPWTESNAKMKENTIKLVTNSNVCLFKSRKTHYQCFYCNERYFSTIDLRKHYENLHDDKKKITKALRKSSTYKNAEITNLACKRCQRPCGDLDDLQGHLVDHHKVTFTPEGHLLMSYKFEDEMKCFLCGAEFLSFMRLAVHMNTHYPHNVCEVCGAAFVAKLSLRLHQNIHSEKMCNLCDFKFVGPAQKRRHMATAHGIKENKTYKCILCSDVFKYFYKLRQHKVEAHGADGSRRYPCADCDKTFKLHGNLKIHIRSVHLRERRFQCSSCDKSFFTKTDQTRHERSHGQATIPCSHCSTRFKTKDSWRRHQRRQHPNISKK